MGIVPRAGLPQWSPVRQKKKRRKKFDGTFKAEPPTRASSSDPWPPAFSVVPGSSHALGLGLGGKPESGLSSPLSAPQLITSSGSPSQTLGKLRLPTISGLQIREEGGEVGEVATLAAGEHANCERRALCRIALPVSSE